MEQVFENIVVYTLALGFCLIVVMVYLLRQRRNSRRTEEKIRKAKTEGLFEPVSLHPVVDVNRCIRTGACIAACPEKDILGIRNGKATTVNASQCIGHGACFHACPTEAISLCIGTEKRGVELPHVNQYFETNVPGIYIAGELGGMGLIRNAVEQGQQAVENMLKSGKNPHHDAYDLVIVGAGPAGIAASLTARKHGLRFLTLEQDTLGGTVFTFPRSKVVMTAPMDLPLYGKVKLYETSKTELLDLWNEVLGKNDIAIRENSKVESIARADDLIILETLRGDKYPARHVLLAIGRRGSPRKLGIPGETMDKVAYRLLEPEAISGKKIVVVGGGDSAVESALLLADQNEVMLAYRGDAFSRIKPKNQEGIREAAAGKRIEIRFNTRLTAIDTREVTIIPAMENAPSERIPNDLVYIFAGGELPTQFLEKAGIRITKKFGDAMLKHR
jgi:thioredoxin reductase/Pyruvate/2-oxoacid:ferredoxin oxidoreductase delta subunit